MAKINIILWMYPFVKIQRFERITEVKNPSITGREQTLINIIPFSKIFSVN